MHAGIEVSGYTAFSFTGGSFFFKRNFMSDVLTTIMPLFYLFYDLSLQFWFSCLLFALVSFSKVQRRAVFPCTVTPSDMQQTVSNYVPAY